MTPQHWLALTATTDTSFNRACNQVSGEPTPRVQGSNQHTFMLVAHSPVNSALKKFPQSIESIGKSIDRSVVAKEESRYPTKSINFSLLLIQTCQKTSQVKLT